MDFTNYGVFVWDSSKHWLGTAIVYRGTKTDCLNMQQLIIKGSPDNFDAMVLSREEEDRLYESS